MAYSSTAGSEVQKPLATVVIVGILIGTVITLTAFPGLLKIMMRGYKASPPANRAVS
jgi:cobalt-zinc-cadmium resistance protein CzcA